MKIRSNLLNIFRESYRWRNRQLLEMQGFNEPALNWRDLFLNNFPVFILGIFFAVFFSEFINVDFSGYIITALSIFIGLFTSVLLMIINNYTNHSFHKNQAPSTKEKLDFKRTKNFSRRFVFVCLESLIIAVTIIILLLFPLMFGEGFLISLRDYNFIFRNLEFNNVILFIKNFSVFLTRAFLFLLLVKFFKFLFFIFGSLGTYLKGVFNNNVRI